MRPRLPWMIVFAIALHLAWGSLLICSSGTAYVTAINRTAADVDRQLLGAAMIGAALLATYSLMRGHQHRPIVGLALLIPQQFLLMLSAANAITAVSLSAFGDGVVRERTFILADQFPGMLATLLHTLAVLDLYGGDIWKRILSRWQRSS